MYCKSCGKQIPDHTRFCPNCGAPVSAAPAQGKPAPGAPAGAARAVRHTGTKKGSGFKPGAAAAVLVILAAVLWFSGVGRKDAAARLVGVWANDEMGEVTFTDDGQVMFGADGWSFGGGWINYSVVGDDTICITGGDLPVGINISYELKGNTLTLEIGGETEELHKK